VGKYLSGLTPSSLKSVAKVLGGSLSATDQTPLFIPDLGFSFHKS
jgi:hypothetical protein